jgi:hypothetical protein
MIIFIITIIFSTPQQTLLADEVFVFFKATHVVVYFALILVIILC